MPKQFHISLFSRIINFINKIFIGPIAKYIFLALKLEHKYRVLNTNHTAIGHLCIDVDCFLKEKLIGTHDYIGVLLASRSTVANIALSKLWGKIPGLIVIKCPLACYLLDYLRCYENTNYDCSRYAARHDEPAMAHAIYGKYNKSEKIISWDMELYKKAKVMFDRYFPGVDSKKIVVFHVRDSFFDLSKKNNNFYSQNFRNSDINSYAAILNYLEQHGYTVIRIGEYQKIKTENKNYINLPDLCRFERDLINLYISSVCSFFLGSASGAPALATIWNRPIFILNVLPYSALRQISPNSMAIPKLLSINSCILGIREIFEMGYYNLALDSDYEKYGIKSITNDPLDCLLDFEIFFNAFVLNNRQKKPLRKSQEQFAYRNLCPINSYDYFSQGLVPRVFFNKYFPKLSSIKLKKYDHS